MRVIPVQTYTQRKQIAFKSTPQTDASYSAQTPDKAQFKENMSSVVKAQKVVANPMEAMAKTISKGVKKTWDVIKEFFKPRTTNRGDIDWTQGSLFYGI